MSRFDKVKKYYEDGLWNKTMVNNAVAKHWISMAEYEAIIGEPYIPINE